MLEDWGNVDNRLLAVRAIRQVGRLTRRDIASGLRISLSLATKISAELIDRGIIFEKGKSEANTIGRPVDWLALVPDTAFAVGLVISHTQQTAVITDLNGDVIADIIEPIQVTGDRTAIIAGMKDLTERVIRKGAILPSKVAGVGVSLHDIVDPVTRTSYGWPDLPGWSTAWSDFDVGDALADALDYPHIYVDDIARTLGLAEARYGEGVHESNFVYVLVDEGIGMAIMLNGTPYIGYSHIAGEIAHIPVGLSSEMCSCGNVGCLQVHSGIRMVLTQAQQKLNDSPVRSVLRTLDHEMQIEDIFLAADAGDKLAIQVVTDAGVALGKALAVIINLLGPRFIVLGGVFSSSDTFIDAAQRSMHMNALTIAVRDVTFRRSALDHLGGARGAATQVLDALFSAEKNNILDTVDMWHAINAQ